MGRKSRGRGQGHRSRPGRGALWSGASVGGHRPRADQSRRASRQDLGEDAPLHVGGLRLDCNGDSLQEITGTGRRQGKSRSQKPAQKFQDDFDSGSEASSSDSDNALEDYLSNLQCDSDNSNSYERQELHLLEQFTAARVGHQAAVECMQEAAQGLADSLDGSSSGDEDEDRETATSDSESDISIDDIITDLGDGLSLMEKFPVLLNHTPPSSNSQGAKSKSGQKRRGGAVRGANNGKLLPGEKKRLKREKVNAKRAARSAAHGLDLESVNAELAQFVASDGDMKGFPPMNKYGLQTVMKLASCYGLKSSAQGSGKNQFVVVASCERTCLPIGEAAAKVQRILKEQNSFESAMRVARLGSRTGSRPVRKSFGSGQPQPQRFNQPISFVSCGTVGTDPMEIRPALQRMPAAIDNTASDASTVDAATTTAAENTDNAWPAAAPQLRDATQAAEPLQPSAAIQAPVSGVGAVLQDSDASASEAPWDAVDCSIPPSTPLGLGCAVLPDFDYPEDNHAGLGSQAAARPLYDRLDSSLLGSAERNIASSGTDAGTSHVAADAGEGIAENAEDILDQIVPHGGYVYERRPNMPKSFMTKQDVKRASKKEQKLARHAQRDMMQQAGQLLIPEPTAVATNLHYGKFEQHTTGYGSRMMARWGFAGQGAGLGRDQQGIAEPVAAFVRPKKLGLGHN